MARKVGTRDRSFEPIELPYKWAPMPHQVNLWNAFVNNGCKRGVAIWHRRAGKDMTALNIMATLMHSTEPHLYYYMAPTQKHARKIIWDNINDSGMRPVDQAIPHQLRESTNDQEMRIVTKHGSIFQVVGSDNHDSIVGTDPYGIVFSEWAIAEKPQSWDYMRPILERNKGWALFIYTPRGFNHGYHTWNHDVDQEDWYSELLTVNDTGIFTPEQMEKLRKENITGTSGGDGSVEQEFFCRFEAPNDDQVFDGADISRAAENDGETPIDSMEPVIMGVDVAHYGGDQTVFAFRVGDSMTAIKWQRYKGLDGKQIAYRIATAISKYKVDACFIDSTSDHSVIDELKYMDTGRCRVLGVHFGESAPDSQYANLRAYMYAEFANWLKRPGASIPRDRKLMTELSAITYEIEERYSRKKIPTKKELRKRLGRSPDDADAAALTFARTYVRKIGDGPSGGGKRFASVSY